jgi:hypothetical protein
MNDFLTFRKMITPLFIQVIFWVGVVGAVIAALITMFHTSFFAGIVALVVLPLFVRIYCELLILFFKIHEELVSIRQALGGSSPGGFPVMPAVPVAPAPGGQVPPPTY